MEGVYMQKTKLVLAICFIIAVTPITRLVVSFLDYPQIDPPEKWELKSRYKEYMDDDFAEVLKHWTQNLYEFYNEERKTLYKFQPEKVEHFLFMNKAKQQTLNRWSKDNDIRDIIAKKIARTLDRMILVNDYRELNKSERKNIIRGIEKFTFKNINSRKRIIRAIKTHFAKDVKYYLDFFE